jgi:hypothetical protein
MAHTISDRRRQERLGELARDAIRTERREAQARAAHRRALEQAGQGGTPAIFLSDDRNRAGRRYDDHRRALPWLPNRRPRRHSHAETSPRYGNIRIDRVALVPDVFPYRRLPD